MRVVHCIDGGQWSCFCTVTLTDNCLLLKRSRSCVSVQASRNRPTTLACSWRSRTPQLTAANGAAS